MKQTIGCCQVRKKSRKNNKLFFWWLFWCFVFSTVPFWFILNGKKTLLVSKETFFLWSHEFKWKCIYITMNLMTMRKWLNAMAVNYYLNLLIFVALVYSPGHYLEVLPAS